MITYNEVNQALEGKYKKQFDKIYKRLSYQITYLEMEALYCLLEGISYTSEVSARHGEIFKNWLKIK